MNHPCEVWGIGKSWRLRMTDRFRHGHARHVCERERPAFRAHEGDHECRCGQRYAKTETDDLW